MVSGSPTITFLTMTAAPLVLVKVQVTVSPASALKVAVAVPTLPVLLVSSQLMLVRTQPAGTVSVEVYWPGATLAVIVPLLVEIGRAACRERVEISVVAVSLKKKKHA